MLTIILVLVLCVLAVFVGFRLRRRPQDGLRLGICAGAGVAVGIAGAYLTENGDYVVYYTLAATLLGLAIGLWLSQQAESKEGADAHGSPHEPE